jgi:Leucine-rich repeat (LRR) protein
LDRLEAVGLSDNRLTAISLPTIIENLNPTSVKFLDLSFNDLVDKGSKSLAVHFGIPNNALRYLDVCNCGLRCEDVKILCSSWKIYPNALEELYLAGNKIAADGATGELFLSLCMLILL